MHDDDNLVEEEENENGPSIEEITMFTFRALICLLEKNHGVVIRNPLSEKHEFIIVHKNNDDAIAFVHFDDVSDAILDSDGKSIAPDSMREGDIVEMHSKDEWN